VRDPNWDSLVRVGSQSKRSPSPLCLISCVGWLGAGLTGDWLDEGWMEPCLRDETLTLCRRIADMNESKESGLPSLSLKLCSWFTFTAANEVK
jgi:hypothetical protein